MKITKKEKVETSKAPEPEKKALVVKKKLTPVKEAEPKVETKVEAPAAPEVSPPKIERPVMPEGFCMELSDWEGSGVCYDPGSNNCTTCEKDFPETAAVCKARTDFLGIVGSSKTAKAKKTGAVRVKKNGKPPQSTTIDEYLKAGKSLSEMYAALAERDFGGASESALKAAEVRVASHLKAIQTGTYCRATEMKPFTAYLSKPAPAPAKKK